MPVPETMHGGTAGPATRRSFLTRVGVGWAVFAGAAAAMLGALIRYLFPNDLLEEEVRFRAGRVEDYLPGQVDGRFRASREVWVVRERDELYVLSASCTHLRCPLSFNAMEQKFRCPCHGSGFHKSGINFEGPAPRALERYRVTLSADGEIEIDLSRKFQEELGQWSDPESHLTLPS